MMLLITLFRLHHWIKNLFLFIPIYFAGELLNWDKMFATFIGFVAFGFGASAIYILNDIQDLEEDRLHPRKSSRPIASGEVSVRSAYILSVVSFLIAMGFGYYSSTEFLVILLIYLLMNVGYSMGLKNRSIIDIFILAIGFELRVLAGGVSADVPVTQWLMVMF